LTIAEAVWHSPHRIVSPEVRAAASETRQSLRSAHRVRVFLLKWENLSFREDMKMGTEGALVHVDDKNFELEIIKSDKPALVDFWAPWCGPCRAIGPILEELSLSYKDQVKIAKMNVDENPKTATAFGVRSIPMLLLFKDGKVLDTLVGLVPRERLEAFIQKGL
jgi:thioredoxin 1